MLNPFFFSFGGGTVKAGCCCTSCLHELNITGILLQGAIDASNLETRIKVTNPNDPEPSIKLYVENQSDPAMRLVSEMMILCGEVIATYGSYNKIPLPYRGQPQSNIDTSAFAHLPEGPVRNSAIVRIMHAAEMDFRKPVRHGILGIPGYVQFTSPIRRYMDLLAHYQVILCCIMTMNLAAFCHRFNYYLLLLLTF